jgi:hypothetical protein
MEHKMKETLNEPREILHYYPQRFNSLIPKRQGDLSDLYSTLIFFVRTQCVHPNLQ